MPAGSYKLLWGVIRRGKERAAEAAKGTEPMEAKLAALARVAGAIEGKRA